MSKLRLTILAPILALAFGTAAWTQSPPVTPADFAAAATGSDAYEIMAGHVALTASKNTQVHAFAERMVREHTAAAASLRQAAVASGLTPPPLIVGTDQAALLAALQSLRGDAFDKAYARQQLLAHRQARATEGDYAQQGTDAHLRAVAQADLPMIERHLKDAQTLRSATGD